MCRVVAFEMPFSLVVATLTLRTSEEIISCLKPLLYDTVKVNLSICNSETVQMDLNRLVGVCLVPLVNSQS